MRLLGRLSELSLLLGLASTTYGQQCAAPAHSLKLPQFKPDVKVTPFNQSTPKLGPNDQILLPMCNVTICRHLSQQIKTNNTKVKRTETSGRNNPALVDPYLFENYLNGDNIWYVRLPDSDSVRPWFPGHQTIPGNRINLPTDPRNRPGDIPWTVTYVLPPWVLQQFVETMLCDDQIVSRTQDFADFGYLVTVDDDFDRSALVAFFNNVQGNVVGLDSRMNYLWNEVLFRGRSMRWADLREAGAVEDFGQEIEPLWDENVEAIADQLRIAYHTDNRDHNLADAWVNFANSIWNSMTQGFPELPDDESNSHVSDTDFGTDDDREVTWINSGVARPIREVDDDYEDFIDHMILRDVRDTLYDEGQHLAGLGGVGTGSSSSWTIISRRRLGA